MPRDWSCQSRDFLLSQGVNLEYHNFHMDHTITEESLGVVRDWLNKQLS